MPKIFDLYSNSNVSNLRFVLGRSGVNAIFVIGLNPSTATSEKSDTTIAKVEEVSRRAGHSGFVMLNLYPERATNYNKLPRTVDRAVMSRNLVEIEAVFKGKSHPNIWAAWGEAIMVREFFRDSLIELRLSLDQFAPNWLHFGPLTANGHPRHPSRLNYSWSFSSFDIGTYISRLGT